MYLKASKYPTFDPAVKSLQIKLNVIRVRVSGNWSHLMEDGLFGEQTKLAVKGFQIYRGITPVSGDVGNTTMDYINNVYNYKPKIQVQHIDKDVDKPFLHKVLDFVTSEAWGLMQNISDAANDEMRILKLFKEQDPWNPELQKLINKRFIGNPKLTELQSTVKKIWEKENKKTFLRWLAEKEKKLLRCQAEKLYRECIEPLTEIDFAKKIEQYMKKGPQITKRGSLKGTWVLNTIAFVPLISNILIYLIKVGRGEPADKELDNIKKDIKGMLEGLIIGGLVTALVAAIGLTGWIAVLVSVVVGVIIGFIIAICCPEDTLTEWIVKEIGRTLHSPVFQSAIRTSFV